MHTKILEPRLRTEYLTDERQSTTVCISVYKWNKRTGHKVFSAATASAAAASDDDEDGNDDSENNDKYLVISTIHEAFQSELFSTFLLLDPS